MDDALSQGTKLGIRELRVTRGQRQILTIPSLDILAGEVLAIVGPNGAGKTTLVTQLALLERPAAGQILFEGKSTSGRELALRRRMAVVFQEPLLLDRSVIANVESGLAIRGIRDRKKRAGEWLQRFGIEDLAQRSSRTLSGGEAQRVSLARAFALEPEVLFLDEPFSALDAPTRIAITDDLSAALAETHTTTVLVTHDHDEAARLGSRIAVLIGGQLRQIGLPAEVFGAPADEAVASFVGVETIVEAQVVRRDGDLVRLEAAGQQFEALDSRSFTRALVCLRPEDVSLTLQEAHKREAQSTRNALRGRVVRLTMTGGDARVELDCGFQLRARITRRSAEELRLEPGRQVTATFKATVVHLIPK